MKCKFFKWLGLTVLILLGMMLTSWMLTPSSNAQINTPNIPAELTVDAARLRAYIGGTNATAGVTTNRAFLSGTGVTNTFVIVNGIITSVQ